MRAYQVHYGSTDKHDRQTWELKATYLSKERALERCERIVSEEKLGDGDVIEAGKWTDDGKQRVWYVHGWDYVGLCRFEEIDITE